MKAVEDRDIHFYVAIFNGFTQILPINPTGDVGYEYIADFIG